MSRIKPLSEDHSPELKNQFDFFNKTLGFVPNSLLTMQRIPKITAGLIQLSAAIYDPEGDVDLGFKRLVAHVASAASGCQYCKAHTAVSASRHGVSVEKLEDIWNYRNSQHYSDAEQVALDYALAAASVPNAVSDELFNDLQSHWTDDQIIELTAVVGLFGFFNRWNDSMGTPLEAEPLEVAEKHLAKQGWKIGKHVPIDS